MVVVVVVVLEVKMDAVVDTYEQRIQWGGGGGGGGGGDGQDGDGSGGGGGGGGDDGGGCVVAYNIRTSKFNTSCS